MRARPTHCKRGHEFTPENTATTRTGTRSCRACDDARKAAHHERTRPTRERQVQVFCPSCKRGRSVVATTAKRLAAMPRVCRSCSRKEIRRGMKFEARSCAKCAKPFAGRSGAARFCDACAGRTPVPVRECPMCGKSFTGYASKKTCSPSCQRRLSVDATYFGGRMREAIGWETKTCQVCERGVAKRFHVHHVFGHPDHSMLVVLCPGCHEAVSKLASRKTFGQPQFDRLRWFALAQRNGASPYVIQLPGLDLEPQPFFGLAPELAMREVARG